MKQLLTTILIILFWFTPLLCNAQTINDPLYNQQTYLQTVNIPQAWSIESGSTNVTIGVVAPGGIYKNHEDLNSRVTLKYQSAIQGLLPHGTIVAGIAGASTNNNKGIAGINWNSPIYSYDAGKIKTINWEENGFPMSQDFFVLDKSKIANRIHDARSDDVDILMAPFHLVPDDQIPSISSAEFQIYPVVAPPHIVDFLQNIYENVTSLFTADQALTEYTNTMYALRSAYIDGTTIVSPMPEYDGVLKGMPSNLNPDRISIAVGSTNLVGDSPYLYSASGASSSTEFSPEVDIVAPGVDVLTTLNTQSDEYDEVTTTVASSGIVGGVASLLKSNNNDLKPDDIREIMRRTAIKFGSQEYDTKTGFGLLNAQAALQYLEDNTITHGVLDNTTSTKIQSNQQKTLFKGPWGNLSSGAYSVDVYEVKGTVDLPSGDEDVWYRAKGTTGWSMANPNFQRPFTLIDIDKNNQEVTFTTFVYHVKYNSIGQQINEWHPAHKDHVEIAYTLAGDPLPPLPPNPPTITMNDSGFNPQLSWSAVSGASSYNIYRATVQGTSSTINCSLLQNYGFIETTTSTGYTDPFVTIDPTANIMACYHVTSNNSNGESSPSNMVGTQGMAPLMVASTDTETPEVFALNHNYPNPFNPSSTIRYDLPERADVTLTVYNMLGQQVAILINGEIQPGRHEATFDASNLSSGNYIARLSALGVSGEQFIQTLNMQLIK